MRRLGKRINSIRRISFSSLIETLITVSFVSLILSSLLITLKWLLFEADWTVVTQNLSLYGFGIFPKEQQWRPAIWLLSLFSLAWFTLVTPKTYWIHKALPAAWIGIVPLGIYLLSGGPGLLAIGSRYWGGITLSIMLMACSALIAFPFGMLLALGRQSQYPLIKYLSSIYIDSIRAIPLITILFFGQLLIPLFLPFGLEINRVLRAVIAFAVFVSAYVAEDIRGGLQAIPKSQVEAAKSLGLSTLQINKLIILPQALTIALPALSNQVIGLLQNTSLMAILGLVELLGISKSILANPDFIGRYIEVYVWLALIYWIICTIIALLARGLEQKLAIEKSDS